MPERTLSSYVEAIPGTPLPYGLFSAATIITPGSEHEMMGVEWMPMSCAEAQTTTWCPPDDADVPTKDFARTGVDYAPPVTVYYGTDCPPIGQDDAEARAYVRAGLAIGEQRALEKWFWDVELVPAVTDITPGTTPGIGLGLGLLEEALSNAYGGVGVIHFPIRAVAPARHVILDPSGPVRKTSAGNVASLGGGYSNTNSDGDAVAADQAYLIATGPVIIRRDDVDVPGADAAGIDIRKNDRYILAERTSVVGFECVAVGITVDLTKS